MAEYLDVDPLTLRLPNSRLDGADPIKFTRQLSRYGTSTGGMPPLIVIRVAGGELMLMDGVTRATRVAKFLPGRLVRVEVMDNQPWLDLSSNPTVGDRLP